MNQKIEEEKKPNTSLFLSNPFGSSKDTPKDNEFTQTNSLRSKGSTNENGGMVNNFKQNTEMGNDFGMNIDGKNEIQTKYPLGTNNTSISFGSGNNGGGFGINNNFGSNSSFGNDGGNKNFGSKIEFGNNNSGFGNNNSGFGNNNSGFGINTSIGSNSSFGNDGGNKSFGNNIGGGFGINNNGGGLGNNNNGGGFGINNSGGGLGNYNIGGSFGNNNNNNGGGFGINNSGGGNNSFNYDLPKTDSKNNLQSLGSSGSLSRTDSGVFGNDFKSGSKKGKGRRTNK